MNRLAASPLLALVLTLALGACGGGSDRVIIGAGTTLVDSGFIDALVAEYEMATGNDVSVIGESSQRLFDLARRGEVDLLLTHERQGLASFIADGYSTISTDVLASRFLLVGPPDLVSTLGADDAGETFAEIARRRLPFVSRADGSGTYLHELAMWEAAGLDPEGDWYDTTGQGMGLTLQVADQRQAFVVVEEGTWLEADLSLVAFDLAGDWPNIYTSTVVAGTGANAEGFHAWLLSDEGKAAVTEVNEHLFGTIVYRPVTE